MDGIATPPEIAARTTPLPGFVAIRPARWETKSPLLDELEALRQNRFAIAERERLVRTWES